MIKKLNEKQEHIVFNDKDNGQVHVLPLALIREVANGRHNLTDDEVSLFAKIILDNLKG